MFSLNIDTPYESPVAADAGIVRLRTDDGRIGKTRSVLVAHDPRQLGRGVVKLEVADQVGLAARNHFLLHIRDRHGLGELLRLAA